MACRCLEAVPVTPEMTRQHGILPFIDPLPRFALSQPGNILRIFERGGESTTATGQSESVRASGPAVAPLVRTRDGHAQSHRSVFLNLQKTRLHDPLLDFMGSNNHPGDYRSSGCTAVPSTANDRSPTHSGWYSKYGHQGWSFSDDKAIRKDERGHPIKHQFTRATARSA